MEAKGSRLKKGWNLTIPERFEGFLAVISRVLGALVRAILVILVVATPALLLPGLSQDAKQIIMLVALFCAGITWVEYSSSYPGIVEFRNAPPFNRVRFVSLFLTVFFLSILFRGLTETTTLTRIVEAVGLLIGHAIDFPYSPVRLMMLLLPDAENAQHVRMMRSAAGITFLIGLATVTAFMIVIRSNRWPNRAERFNFWTNLPTFDPTMGGDVVTRLNRDARINILLGFVLPFFIPIVASSASRLFEASMMDSPQSLVWMIALWSFLPVSLIMRGIAMNRIADIIDEQRTRGTRAVLAGLQAV